MPGSYHSTNVGIWICEGSNNKVLLLIISRNVKVYQNFVLQSQLLLTYLKIVKTFGIIVIEFVCISRSLLQH